MRIFLNSSIFLFFSLFLSSCFSTTNRKIEEESQEIVTTGDKVKREERKETVSQSKDEILNANIYLEISGGMVGFMPQGGANVPKTEFQDKVASLLTDVNYNPIIKDKQFYYIREENGDAKLVKGSYENVLKTVSSGTPHPALGTELPEMLKKIMEESGKTGALSVIVSDFIYGPADKTKFSIIPQLIRGALNEAAHKKLVVSVFSDQSAFYGIYYPAVKVPKQQVVLSGTKIPFYIWIIGKQEDVLEFNNKVFKNQAKQQVHYGFNFNSIAYEALPKFEEKGIVYCSTRERDGGCKSVTLEVSKGNPVEFEVGINLNQLPQNVKTDEYLKKNLQLVSNGVSVSLLGIKKATKETKANTILSQYTHFIRLKVVNISASTGKLELKLSKAEPSWIHDWATTNDNNPISVPGKTFKIDEILRGVDNLYSVPSKSIFNVYINYIKG